jgi:hypothetical protein
MKTYIKGTNVIDLTGKRFGRLIVKSYVGPIRDKSTWLCLCDCGKEKNITYGPLAYGHTKSCGCLLMTAHLLPGDGGSFNQFYDMYKDNSRKRGLEFSLSKEEFRLIAGRVCQYCGSEPKPHYAKRRAMISVIPYLCNGIDRVDNDKGYIAFNCVPCCSLCNYMKRGLSSSEFITHVHRISSYPEVK